MGLKSIFCLFIAHLAIICCSNDELQHDAPIIALRNPKRSLVKGHVLKTDIGNNIYAYQDIPYAEPPIGERRYQLPVLSKGWHGVREATQTKQICLQVPVEYFNRELHNSTEDCLVINVYSPVGPDSKQRLPVLLFIHGGGFLVEGGVIEEFDPKYFIDEKIVFVTFNYRLDAMGFLTTGDDVIPANLGLHDQKLAMRWVHENIEAFGGDASNVVIAGESAGGASVSWHLIGSKPSEYYSGAIISSGSAMCPFAYNTDVKSFALEFARTLDPSFSSNKSEDILRLLQEASSEDLQKVIENAHLTFAPTIGTGDDFALPQTEAFDNGNSKRVPLLVGFNSEEYWIFFSDLEHIQSQAAALDTLCNLDSRYNILEKDREAACMALKRLYTNGDFSDDIPAFIRFSTDDQFLRPILRNVQSYSKYVSETFLYQLAYAPSMSPKSPYAGIEGVAHADDLLILFNQHGVSVNFTETDKIMSKRIVKLWSNFIKHRNPTPHPEELLENIVLPPVNPQEIWYLNLTTTMTIATNPRNCDKWANVYDSYLQHPITIY